VHGDYHLGQVMRTDAGWYVLDFEGEPARPLAERSRPTSPIKDVTGMLRSFAYASAVGLRSRTADELERLGPLAMAWESHNRAAFLDGYQSEPGIEELMPADADMATVTEAYELDKALYEFEYERAYRPEWTSIPRSAIVRLVGASPEGSGSGSVG
jgi:maltokinase